MLYQVLKRVNWAENGGQAKALIADGLVSVNGEIELRKMRLMTLGDIVEFGGHSLILVREATES